MSSPTSTTPTEVRSGPASAPRHSAAEPRPPEPGTVPTPARGRRGRRLGHPVALALTVILTLGLLYLAISGYMALSATRPDRHAFTHTPEQYGLASEDVAFPSRVDALPLSGWLLRPPTEVAWQRPVVFVHGKGGDRQSERSLEIAADLVQRQGRPTLVFDLRGSGRSGGERFTLGAQEVRDVGGAVDFLRNRGLGENGVDLVGFSMGAATAMLVAEADPAIHAVVEDSGYADLGDVLEDQVPKASGLPPFFTPGVVLMARPLIGVDAYAIRPVDGLPDLARRGVPLLVIHGDADDTVPFSHAPRLARAYGPAVQTYFVHGASHVKSYDADPPTYLARVAALFGVQKGVEE